MLRVYSICNRQTCCKTQSPILQVLEKLSNEEKKKRRGHQTESLNNEQCPDATRTAWWQQQPPFAVELLSIIPGIREKYGPSQCIFRQWAATFMLARWFRQLRLRIAAKQVAKYNNWDHDHSFVYPASEIYGNLGLGSHSSRIPVFGILQVGKELDSTAEPSWAVLIFWWEVIRGDFSGVLTTWSLTLCFDCRTSDPGHLGVAHTFMRRLAQWLRAAVILMTCFIGISEPSVLFYYLVKDRLALYFFRKQKRWSEGIDTGPLWSILTGKLFFIITGSAIQLPNVDQMTFINVMSWFTDYSQKALAA